MSCSGMCSMVNTTGLRGWGLLGTFSGACLWQLLDSTAVVCRRCASKAHMLPVTWLAWCWAQPPSDHHFVAHVHNISLHKMLATRCVPRARGVGRTMRSRWCALYWRA